MTKRALAFGHLRPGKLEVEVQPLEKLSRGALVRDVADRHFDFRLRKDRRGQEQRGEQFHSVQ